VSKKDLIIAKEYLLWLKKNGVRFNKGYIFGSRAKGTARKDSDLDICIVSDDFGKDLHDQRVELMNLSMKISDIIEPHPMTTVDFNDKYNTLAYEVKKWGVVV